MKNMKVGSEVLVIGTPEPRGNWKIGTGTEVHPRKDGLVRAVTISTKEGVVTRPVTKVASLERVGRW